MTKSIDLIQGTQEWLDWRENGITATEAACAMGVSKWGTALSVYNDKLNGSTHEPSEYEEWGSLLENVIKFNKFAKEHTEFAVTQGGCYEREWRKCSLDGELYQDGKRVAILEIKTASSDSDWDPVPKAYYAQVQWQMHVTGIELTYFAVLVNGHHYFERLVHYDPGYCGKLEEACSKLWQCIINKTPPTIDKEHTDIDIPVASKLAVNTERESTYELSDEEYATFEILKEQSAKIESALKAHKAMLTQYLMTNKYLTYKGVKVGSMVSMKPRESVDTVKLKKEFPDVYEQVKKLGQASAYPKFG